MNEFGTLLTGQPAAQEKPKVSAAHRALLDRKVLPLASLVHGAYYSGLLGDTTTVGRWNAQKHRFVVWEHEVGQLRLKAAPHVADIGTGPRFAPLSAQKVEGAYHITDFALETTH